MCSHTYTYRIYYSCTRKGVYHTYMLDVYAFTVRTYRQTYAYNVTKATSPLTTGTKKGR